MPTTPPPPPLRIAIIGAGPAGLTLARLLHVSPVPFTIRIYEADASPTARHFVGGTLDLHDDTGLAAVRKAGLWDEFKKHARYDGEEIVVADRNATVLVHRRPGAAAPAADAAAPTGGKDPWARPEIDRERLKEILLKSVPEGWVRWGWKAERVRGGGVVEFRDGRGEEGPFDLVVGADGAWSRVRAALTPTKPHYSGIAGFEMKISSPASTHPAVNAMVGRGMYMAFGGGVGLTAQRMGDESVKIAAWMRVGDRYAQKLLAEKGPEGVREELLGSWFKGWAPELLDWVRASEMDSVKGWSLYELPVGMRWEHKPGLTLIGDAASLMTPFAGEGVNKAMRDALELADLLGKTQSSSPDSTTTSPFLDTLISQYELSMFPRAEKFQAETARNKAKMFDAGAPIAFMTGMLAHASAELVESAGSWWTKCLFWGLGSWPVVGAVGGWFWVLQVLGRGRRAWRISQGKEKTE